MFLYYSETGPSLPNKQQIKSAQTLEKKNQKQIVYILLMKIRVK